MIAAAVAASRIVTQLSDQTLPARLAQATQACRGQRAASIYFAAVTTTQRRAYRDYTADDVVSLRGCRKLNVEMTNSLVALDGSLLDIRAINKEMAMDLGVRWNMARSSIFTNKAIFAFQFESSKGLTRTSAPSRTDP